MSFQIGEEENLSLKMFVVLSKAYKAVMDRAVKDMKQYALSPSEFMILEVLYTKGRIALQQIAEKILITSGTITYNIDKLEKKGYIRRVPCEDDRRVIFAEMTTAGQELFDRIFPEHASKIHDLTQGLTAEEKQDAVKLLKKLGTEAENH